MKSALNFSAYEFRCSALGKVVSKTGKLTDGVKTYLQELFIGELYGIQKTINSKYFEKGTWQEEDGITMLQKTLHPGKLLLKNKERKRNGWIHGEHDTLVNGIVYDIKNAWDRFTFGKASLSWDYEWQLRGYMWLNAVDRSRLFYCLNNTPEHILMDEERRLFYQHRFISPEDTKYIEMCDELRKAHNYDGMPLEDRFKVWDVLIDPDKIELLQVCITQAREYLNLLAAEHLEQIANNRRLMGLADTAPTPILTIHDPAVSATLIEPL